MKSLSTLAKGDSSHIAERRHVVVKSPEEWSALWAAHAGPAGEAPTVDFASVIVAGAFAGTQPPGCTIEVVGAVEEEGGTRLIVEERTGSDPNGTVPVSSVANSAASAPLAPFHLVLLPRVDGEIRWTDASRKRRAPPADPAERIARSVHGRSTATGLRPRTAAVLSYLAGPVSGVVMLIAEPAQPFVRFHAWQSVIALGALTLTVGVCYVLAFASLFFSANGLAVMVRVATAVWIGLLLLWIVLIWQAWKGRSWKLPVAGGWAEQLATRAGGQPPASSGQLNKEDCSF